MTEWLEVFKYPLLLGGGFIAGIINTLAGNGSAITLSLLMLFGLPADLANATNRVGVFFQASTALVSFRRTAETQYLFRHSAWIILPAALGSALGAWVAADIPESLLKGCIGGLMLALFLVMLVKGRAIHENKGMELADKSFKNGLLFSAIGFYAGFIQMGTGIIMLSIMTLLMPYSLRRANLIKQLLVFVFILLPFAIFIYHDMIRWSIGLILAIGQISGAWMAARYLLQNPKAQKWITVLLMAILLISGITLLGSVMQKYVI